MTERIEIGGFYIEPLTEISFPSEETKHQVLKIGNIANNWQMNLSDDHPQAALLIAALNDIDDDMKSYLHTWLLMVWSMVSTFPDVQMLEDFNNMIQGRTTRLVAELEPQRELTEDELTEDLAIERLRQQVSTEEKQDALINEAMEEVKRNTENNENA